VITIKITDATQGEISDRSSWQPFAASRNLKNSKNILSKLKLIKTSKWVMPHQSLFQHQLDVATHPTWNVTNATFIFATSPNTKPKDKMWGDVAYYLPPSEKVRGTRPRVSHLIAPMTKSSCENLCVGRKCPRYKMRGYSTVAARAFLCHLRQHCCVGWLTSLHTAASLPTFLPSLTRGRRGKMFGVRNIFNQESTIFSNWSTGNDCCMHISRTVGNAAMAIFVF